MQFVYPGFLWALLLLAIPILIHLFYFRRYRRVLFSNVRFLKEIKEETSARNKLRNLLILLMRLLAIAFLLIAFAQPFIPGSSRQAEGIKSVSVFIDNSFSMSSFDSEFSLLDQARQKAREIIEGYSIDDRFQILTQELSGDQQRTLSQEEAISRIEEIEIGPERNPLSLVYERQKQWLEETDTENKAAFWLSDFQENILSPKPVTDSTIQLNVLPLKAVRAANVAIDSCWMVSPVQMLNQTATLLLRIHNYGNLDAEQVPVSVEVNGQSKPLGSIDIRAGQSYVDTATFTILKTGWHDVIARLTDFPVQFDDTYYLSFYVDEQIRVLTINDQRRSTDMEAVFGNREFYQLESEQLTGLNYSGFPNYNLIVLHEPETISSGLSESLTRYIGAGGKVIFFPSSSGDVESYNRMLQNLGAELLGAYKPGERKVGSVNTDEFIFNDVFEETRATLRLPEVYGSFGIRSVQQRGGETILTYRDGGSYLKKYQVGDGFFYLSTAPLDPKQNTLIQHAEILVPLLYKAAIARSETRDLAYTIGESSLIEVENRVFDSEQIYRFSGPGEFVPGMQLLGSKVLLDVRDQVREAGIYDLLLEDEVEGAYGFNYNRLESDLTSVEQGAIAERIEGEVEIWKDIAGANLTEMINSQSQGKRLWKWCIILALLFLALETAAIRLWKN